RVGGEAERVTDPLTLAVFRHPPRLIDPELLPHLESHVVAVQTFPRNPSLAGPVLIKRAPLELELHAARSRRLALWGRHVPFPDPEVEGAGFFLGHARR